MKRQRKEVYSPPKIKTVHFAIEVGLTVSATGFEEDSWDDDLPGIHSGDFERDRLDNGGSSTTSYELERW